MLRLSPIDRDLGHSIRPETVAINSMTLCEPVPNRTPDFTDKVEAFLSQMSEIANQICDGMLVIRGAVLLKYCGSFSGPSSVFGPMRRVFPCHARQAGAIEIGSCALAGGKDAQQMVGLDKAGESALAFNGNAIFDCHDNYDYGTSL